MSEGAKPPRGRPRKNPGQARLDELFAQLLRLRIKELRLMAKALGLRRYPVRRELLEALSQAWHKSAKTIEDRMSPRRRRSRRTRPP